MNQFIERLNACECVLWPTSLCVQVRIRNRFLEHNSLMDNERWTMDKHAILLDIFFWQVINARPQFE